MTVEKIDDVRCVMRFFPFVVALYFSGACFAQTAQTDQNFLEQARAKYDTPFERGLKSFSCSVEFDWKKHFTEAVRVGDEGTDEQIAKQIQPIQTKVTVTGTSAKPSSGLTEEQMNSLPYHGMAEGLLLHAVQFSLNNWLLGANNQMLPPPQTPVQVEASATGFRFELKIQSFPVETDLTKDLRLLSEQVKGSASDRRETEFKVGPHGFLMTTYRLGEDGDFRPGNRIIHTYTYQDIGGFQIPEQVTLNRESHREGWTYKLTHCTVDASKLSGATKTP